MMRTTRQLHGDLGILVYHFINQYPDILNYTNQAQVTVKKGLHMRKPLIPTIIHCQEPSMP